MMGMYCTNSGSPHNFTGKLRDCQGMLRILVHPCQVLLRHPPCHFGHWFRQVPSVCLNHDPLTSNLWAPPTPPSGAQKMFPGSRTDTPQNTLQPVFLVISGRSLFCFHPTLGTHRFFSRTFFIIFQLPPSAARDEGQNKNPPIWRPSSPTVIYFPKLKKSRLLLILCLNPGVLRSNNSTSLSLFCCIFPSLRKWKQSGSGA